MAAVLSFFIPGLGHLVLGYPVRGLLWLVIVVIGYFAFIVPGIVLHIICICAAASLSNSQQIELIAQGTAEGRRRNSR